MNTSTRRATLGLGSSLWSNIFTCRSQIRDRNLPAHTWSRKARSEQRLPLIERPDRYGPLFAVDTRHNETLWEIWVAGFEKAVKLRPAAWQKLLTADHETAQAMFGLLTLADVDRRDSRFTPEQLDALTAAAPHQIGPWVVTLNEWRLAKWVPTQDFQTSRSSFSTPASKLGRNDPCPCGSGKKYKKCCGLN